MTTNYVDYTGPHTLDLGPLQGKLVDLEQGAMQGLRTDQPGFKPMALSLVEAMPSSGAAAGIQQDVYEHFVMCNDTVDKIDERLAISAKQAEVLRESRAFYVDARQNDIGLMVDSMRSRAQRRKNPSLIVPFEQVVKYNAQIGDKAVQTRKKNEQAKADPQAAASPDPPAAASPAPPAPPPAAPPAPPV
jgi:hypothetical protein